MLCVITTKLLHFCVFENTKKEEKKAQTNIHLYICILRLAQNINFTTLSLLPRPVYLYIAILTMMKNTCKIYPVHEM